MIIAHHADQDFSHYHSVSNFHLLSCIWTVISWGGTDHIFVLCLYNNQSSEVLVHEQGSYEPW